MPPPSPFAYSSYSPQSQYFSSPYSDHLQLTHHQDFSMHNDPSLSQSMPSPSSPPIQIDPALALYPPYYSHYQQHPSQLQHHLSLPPNYSSSPSSQGSDTIGTPPTEIMMYPASSSNVNGKRPSSSNNMDSRKKARKDDDSETQSPAAEKEEVKAKPTRGSRFVLEFHISMEFWQSFQCLHGLQTFENEVRGCRTRASMQAVLIWKSWMYIWRIQSREKVFQVSLFPLFSLGTFVLRAKQETRNSYTVSSENGANTWHRVAINWKSWNCVWDGVSFPLSLPSDSYRSGAPCRFTISYGLFDFPASTKSSPAWFSKTSFITW